MGLSSPADAFSSVAPAYDRDFGAQHGVPMLRRRVLRYVYKYVPSGATILEIGSGTGEDAHILHNHGYRVTATDPSAGMVRQAQERLVSAGVTVLELPAEAIPGSFPAGSFDAVFSNFGALNCVQELPGLLPQLAGVVKPGGLMILCLLGKYSLWEMTSAFAKLRFRLAFRRLTAEAVPATVGEHQISVRYYSVAEVLKACGSVLRVLDVAGLNVVSPPPAAGGFSQSSPRLTRILDRMDRALERFPGLAAMGDHVLVVLRKTRLPGRHQTDSAEPVRGSARP